MVSRDSERVEVLDGQTSGALLNVSATGAAFIHPEPLVQSRRIILSINNIEFESRVVYCKQHTDGFRIGIHFTTVNLNGRLELSRLVDSFSCGVPLRFQVISVL